MIHATEFANASGTVEQRFGQRGLARVHMRQDTRHDMRHTIHSNPLSPHHIQITGSVVDQLKDKISHQCGYGKVPDDFGDFPSR